MAPQKMDPQMVSSASTGTARYADGLGTCGRSPTGARMQTMPLALEKGAAGRTADRTLGTAVPGAAAALAGTGHCSAGQWAGTGHSPVPSAGH